MALKSFCTAKYLTFLQEHLAEYRNNNFAYQQLKNAFMNMSAVKVTLALDLSENNEHSSWFQVSLKPIYLKRTDFFEQPFSIKRSRKIFICIGVLEILLPNIIWKKCSKMNVCICTTFRLSSGSSLYCQ